MTQRMRRACYCKISDDKYVLKRVKSLRNDGNVIVEDIKEFKDREFKDLPELFLEANSSGYGIIGSFQEVKSRNHERYERKRNGLNMMNIDDL